MIARSLSLLILIFFVSGCSVTSSDETPVSTVYMTMVVENATDTSQNGNYSLTTVQTCTYDGATGLATVSLNSGSIAKPQFNVKLKGFSTSTAKIYTCAQTSGNESGSIGQSFFDECMVSFSVFSDSAGNSLNTYDMHRFSDTIPNFTYATSNTCTVDITATSTTSLSGTVNCDNMPQTYLSGTMRNPVESSSSVPHAKGDVSGSFNCTFTN